MDSELTYEQLKELYENEKASKEKYENDRERLRQQQHDWYIRYKELHIARVRACERIRRQKTREAKLAEKAKIADQKSQSIMVWNNMYSFFQKNEFYFFT